ncbi:DNA topoisomerase I [Thermococcus sp. GR7]|uniref:DNA topoisomerase I n=1 Tax=unclassified Thermococcus TaxID=2627626 RepID=UPI001432180E|nr:MULTISPECIES: DNA topoisomerase I [unclassified Thermococcus]NJE46293.1 DNA topoisomerase I [Thermococcus sp. GR7]NJE79243.1 DNA topoisomerase I [Thermococcus sp. GR4]NJF23828.1 DNA topoisomerase I [Thermococcus sp. GR5]
MVTLIIAEKPNVARKIAYALAEGRPVRKTIGKVPYYEFTRDGKRIIVAPAVGHLFSLAPKTKTYGYPVFDIEWVPVYVAEKGKSYAKDYIKALATLAKRADEFVVACDYDTEGEVIGYTALKYACGVDPSKAKRMKFSALTKKDLLKAWYNLESTINFGMADAGIARHVLDWYWGVNLSRALTSAIKRASGKWMVLSTGRVQGPTLKFLVDREKEIQNFKPTPYWVIKMVLEKNGQQYTAVYEKERILDENEAKRIVEEAKKGPAFVEKVDVKQQNRHPPVPFDLGTLQREAYSAFGYSPKKTLELAQKLYERGLTSYPRTSSQKLPKNLNFRSILQNLAKLPEYKPFAHELLGKERLKPVEGKKDDPAHPAIYPTGELPKPGELTKDEANLYDLIVRRFLALFMEPAVREIMKVIINSNGHRFILSGARTIKEGWLKVYGKYVKFDEAILPAFKEGEPVKVLQIKREKKKTKPPARYSPAAVIKRMEDLGIGTKATRAQILETLYSRGYIEGKKKIKVTPLGMRVVEALERNVPDIVSVELTRAFEEKMDEIMAGKADKDRVIEESKEQLIKILQQFKEKELDIGKALMETTGTGVTTSKENAKRAGTVKELSETEEKEVKKTIEKGEKTPLVVGKCPKCGGDLVVRYNRKTGKRFVGCSNWPKCNVTYPLLQRGRIIPTNKTCCDGAPVVKIREKGREYEICLDMNCKDWKKGKK